MDIKATAFAVSARPEPVYPVSAAASRSSTSPEGSTAPPPGVFISPILKYDQQAKLAVLFFREADTGETRDQIPPKRIVEEYRRNGGRNLGEIARNAASVVTGANTAEPSAPADAGAVPSSGTGAAPAATSAPPVEGSVSGSEGSTAAGSVVSVTV
jgi:hypothetical protein